MKTIKLSLIVSLLFGALAAQAQLTVTVTPVKVAGQKAIVQLLMTNNLAKSVESARAICFLLDDQGKMIGQSTKWVIGGTRALSALQSKSGTTFNFVITNPQPFTTTNLTAKVSFSRVVLAGGEVAEVNKVVNVTSSP